jgi:hypothetical protein
LRYIQFSWRFLSCTTLVGSLLTTFLLDAFWKNEARDKLSGFRLSVGRAGALATVVITLCLALVFSVEKYGEAYFDHGKLRSRPVTANISSRDANGEHTPISANEKEALRVFPRARYVAPRPKLLKTTGQVRGGPKSARRWIIEAETTSPGFVVIPQYWFPGWEASDAVTGENFSVQGAKYSGLVEIAVPQGKHSIDLRLGALGPELVGRWLSVGTACGFGLSAVLMRGRKRRLQDHRGSARAHPFD